MGGQFTGKKLLAILVVGFGIVIAVNLTMAFLASRTFPGMVVENSYVASQNFNAGLQAGREQQARGWKISWRIADGRLVVDPSDANGDVLKGASVSVNLTHPLGAKEPHNLTLAEGDDGIYTSSVPLPGGQWEMELTVGRDGKRHWLRARIDLG